MLTSKKIMQPKTNKSKNNIFKNGKPPQFFCKRKTTSFFLKMEDNLKKIMQLTTIKGKNNGC
jgi:hypothetical protein